MQIGDLMARFTGLINHKSLIPTKGLPGGEQSPILTILHELSEGMRYQYAMVHAPIPVTPVAEWPSDAVWLAPSRS